MIANSCPACVGDAPLCVRDCETQTPVASAFCDEANRAYSCAHLLGTIRQDECPSADAGSLVGQDAGIFISDGGTSGRDVDALPDASNADVEPEDAGTLRDVGFTAGQDAGGDARVDAGQLEGGSADGGASAAQADAGEAAGAG